MSDLPQHVEHGFQDPDGTYQWVRGQPTNPQGDNVTTVYRVYSPTRRMAAYVTDDWGHARGRCSALNQQASTDNGRPDWLVQTATPRWENP